MVTAFNLKKIRTLLTEGFTVEDLRRFCYDESDFRPAYNKLAPNTGKSDLIDLLVEYAEQKCLIKSLLIWAKEYNPARYEETQPYYEITRNEPDLQEAWKIQTSLKPEHLFVDSDYLCLVTKEAIHFLSPSNGKALLPPLSTIENLSLIEYPINGAVFTSSGNLVLTLLPPEVSGKASLWSLKLVRQNEQLSKNILFQRLYEAPSAQLSAPVNNNKAVCFIQRGPEFVMLDLAGDQVCHTLSLPKLERG